MQPPTRSVHILGLNCVIESKKLPAELFGVFGLNTGFGTIPEKSLNAVVPKALYHRK